MALLRIWITKALTMASARSPTPALKILIHMNKLDESISILEELIKEIKDVDISKVPISPEKTKQEKPN